jgi:eukaryotic-like serine/threonine-protein kinase
MDRALRIGKYLTRRTLGAGSFATVWLAYDEMLDAEVAIKVLADNWARNPDVRRRFIDEAKLMRRIDHDLVVRVHDVDELPDGWPFFVMTCADRGTLADRLPAAGSPPTMDVAEAVRIAVEICECLAVVHDFGAVHRDVKPSNVLFRSVRSHERAAAQRRGNNLGDEQMVLGDFGLAKDLAVASGFTQAAGTPAYMAPEQARSSAIIDHRVDVFGAAAVLYEMLTGRPPLAASTLSGVRRNESGEGIVPVRSLRPDTPPAIAAAV